MANASFLPQYTPLCDGIQGCREEDEPSQALPRQLSRRESQAVKSVAKVLSAKRSFPAVDLALPLRKDFPRSEGRCRAATKGGICQSRKALTERAYTVTLVANVSGAMRKCPPPHKTSPLRGRWHRAAMTERVRSLSVFPFHHLCVWWVEKFSSFCTNALKNCRRRMEKTSLSRFTTLPR